MVQFNLTYDPSISIEQRVGFELAAKIWGSYLTDDITVNLHIASSDSLGDNGQAVGGAIPIFHEQNYGIYQQYADADATSESDEQAIENLQVGNTIDFLVNGEVVDGNTDLLLTSAQAKALGMAEALQLDNGGTWNRNLADANDLDGYILVSNAFDWNYDYTRSGEAPEGTLDFMSMALHEIGHQLGFVSGLDGALDVTQLYSGETQAEGFTILDLFRHSDESGEIDNPDGAISDLTIGQNSYFSVDGGETNLGNFSDGVDYQASHWERLKVAMGIMDPTLAYQERTSLGLLDLQAFDALGWDVNYGALSKGLDLDELLQQAERTTAEDLGLASTHLTENRASAENSTSYDLGYGELWQLFEQNMFELGYGELWSVFELGYGELWQEYGSGLFKLGYGELWQLVEENIFKLGYGELWQQFETDMFELGYGELWQQFETDMFELGYGELWQQFEQTLLALGYGELWKQFELGYGELWQEYGSDLFTLGYGELWQLVEGNIFELGYGELWQQFETEMFELGYGELWQQFETNILNLGYGELWQQFETNILKLGYGELWQQVDTLFATIDKGFSGTDRQISDGGVGAKNAQIFRGGDEDDIIAGDEKQDRIKAGDGDDLIDGKEGHDVIWGEKGRDIIYGHDGKDLIYGGDDDDLLLGEAGDDDLQGEAGNDILSGGQGDDILSGGQGLDDLEGGSGKDVLDGGADNDRLDGGANNDILIGGGGRDQIMGGSGDDVIYGDAYKSEESLNKIRRQLQQQSEGDTSEPDDPAATDNINPIRVEVEDMLLTGDYEIENGANDSGSSFIANTSAEATTTFSGPSGSYMVFARYYDSANDANGMIDFSLNGTLVNSFTLDQDTERFQTQTVSSALTLNEGDEFSVSVPDVGDGQVAIDYLEFVSLDNLLLTTLDASESVTTSSSFVSSSSWSINGHTTSSVSGSFSSTVGGGNDEFRVEAEAMTLLGDYVVESNSDSSDGALIGVQTGGEGIALTTFGGEAGYYNIVVGYYDENDIGTGQISAALNGELLDAWSLDQNLGDTSASSQNFLTRTVASAVLLNTDDVFKLTSLGGMNGSTLEEQAYIDYVEFERVSAPSIEQAILAAQVNNTKNVIDESLGELQKSYELSELDLSELDLSDAINSREGNFFPTTIEDIQLEPSPTSGQKGIDLSDLNLDRDLSLDYDLDLDYDLNLDNVDSYLTFADINDINDGTTGSTNNPVVIGEGDNANPFGQTLDIDEFLSLNNDWLEGGTGNDTIYAGSGNDTLYGNAQEGDQLDGLRSIVDTTDNDVLVGGGGDDTIYGNAGDDKLYGDSESYSLTNDFVSDWSFDEAARIQTGDSTSERINALTDRLNSYRVDSQWSYDAFGVDGSQELFEIDNQLDASEQLELTFEDEALVIEEALVIDSDELTESDSFEDALDEVSLNNRGFSTEQIGQLTVPSLSSAQAFGEIGNDFLFGGIGSDTLEGGAGNDVLDGSDAIAVGYLEQDLLVGGLGADTFVIGNENQAYYVGGGDKDYALIEDFNAAEDIVQVHGSVDSYQQQQQDGNLHLSYENELIAVFKNTTALDLNNASIVYV